MKRIALITLMSVAAFIAPAFAQATDQPNPFRTNISFDPPNPHPGANLEITLDGWVFDGDSFASGPPRALRASLIGRTIRVEADRCQGFALLTEIPYHFRTTVRLPTGNDAAGNYSVDYYHINCEGVVRLIERVPLVVSQSFLCKLSPLTLCLSASRFQATAKWRTPDGNSGFARAVQVGDQSGYFWFFTPDNQELLVKVLDACGTSSPGFWVFAAGMTNVEVDLTITEASTIGNSFPYSKTYRSPMNTMFVPFVDATTFPCR